MPGLPLIQELLINIAIAAAILVVGLWLAKRLKNIMSKVMIKRGVDAMLASFMSSIAHIHEDS